MATTKAAPPKKTGWFNTAQPFLVGGLSGMIATSCIQPIDTVKVRIQVMTDKHVKPISLAKNIYRKEGWRALYAGLSAGLLRQASYATVRLGAFRAFSDALKTPDRKNTMFESAVASLAAGALGATIGNPADLSLVRMQADKMLAPELRRNYRHVGDALVRIVKGEGFFGLWKGCWPTVLRAMSMNFGQLAMYDQIVRYVEPVLGKNEATNTTAKLGAAIAASFCSLPFDFIKTRVQQQRPNKDGLLKYKGTLDCVLKVWREEGPFTFYKGFWTFACRVSPHVIITLTAMEQLNNFCEVTYWKPRFRKQAEAAKKKAAAAAPALAPAVAAPAPVAVSAPAAPTAAPMPVVVAPAATPAPAPIAAAAAVPAKQTA